MIDSNTPQELLHSDACRLLAACFYEPDRLLLLEENLAESLATVLIALEIPVSAAILAAGLQHASQQDLLQDYSALFVGPFGLLAAPYGSVYLEKDERRLMGDSSLAVARLYQQAGLQQTIEGPPDHIALELEFMSYLARQTAQAKADGNAEKYTEFQDIRQVFWTRFLAPWIPPFCKAIRTHAQTGFYRDAAEWLQLYSTRP